MVMAQIRRAAQILSRKVRSLRVFDRVGASTYPPGGVGSEGASTHHPGGSGRKALLRTIVGGSGRKARLKVIAKFHTCRCKCRAKRYGGVFLRMSAI